MFVKEDCQRKKDHTESENVQVLRSKVLAYQRGEVMDLSDDEDDDDDAWK